MTEVLTSAQMRAVEGAAIACGKVTGLELMERAGQEVVTAIFEEWPALAQVGEADRGASPPHPPEYLTNNERDWARRAVVLCGPGNNGGDGFVVARLLHQRGWAVSVCLFGEAGKLPPDARVNHDRWLVFGPVEPPEDMAGAFLRADLIIDAMFGTGLTRAMEGGAAELAGQIRGVASPCKVVSVDAPSGMCMDSGRPLGAVVRADLTVSFHSEKPGHWLAQGPGCCGKVVVADIGLEGGDESRGAIVQLVDGPTGPLLKPGGAHKYAHGHAVILSGGMGRSGAARLAARGALRIGAGLVTVGAPEAAMAECAAQLTAIMLRQVDGGGDLTALLEDQRLNAVCLGPGLGFAVEARGLVEAALRSRRAVVLDADALSLVAGDADLFGLLHAGCVLTPHGGEFARLFPDLAELLAAPATKGPAFSKVEAARAAAKRAGCVVLFKGPDTVIAAPDGRCSIHAASYDRAAPWLATAGSGDVLAGFIAGVLARGFGPMQAAETAAWLHVECARAFGPGLIAEDVPEMAPEVLRGLEA